MISPSTIGANANPPIAAASSLPGSTKELKDAMGTLGDWKAKLASRGAAASTESEKERRASSSSGVSDGGRHARSGSNAAPNASSSSFFGEGLGALIGAKDGKPVTKDQPSSPTKVTTGEKGRSDSEASAYGERERGALSQAEKEAAGAGAADELPGHPTRLDESDAVHELDVADWTVDSQGWVYADNHW